VNIGDLVKHTEDNVLGIVVSGPISWEEHPDATVADKFDSRYEVKWDDMSSACHELDRDVIILSSAKTEIQNENR
jgi:hypothetical protein